MLHVYHITHVGQSRDGQSIVVAKDEQEAANILAGHEEFKELLEAVSGTSTEAQRSEMQVRRIDAHAPGVIAIDLAYFA